MATTTLTVRRVPLDSLHPDPANARQHGPENLDAILGSLKRFGQAEPLVVQKKTGRVIGGNGRLTAMRKLGWVHCDVVELDLDDLQATALGIALNRTSDLATWDDSTLAKLLSELKANDALEGVGYSGDEINRLLEEAGELIGPEFHGDEDDIPEPQEDAVSRPADLWILGRHRLLVGDSSKAEDVDRLLGGAKIQLVNTDPPYNVKVEPRSNNAIAAGNSSFKRTHHQKLDLARHPEKAHGTTKRLRAKDRPLVNDFVSEADFERLLQAWFGNMARALEPGRGFYIWGGYANCGNYPPVLKAMGLYFSQALIWVKEHPVLTRKDFMGNHEWCQPGDTMVETPEGPVPISSLRNDDRVISFNPRYHRIAGLREGFPVHRTSRTYSGALLGVNVGKATTWCTPGHFWNVKLSSAAGDWWCVYLMRKGEWWRVGKSKMLSTWGFGIKNRLYTEGGDEAWILSVHPSSVEAAIHEQIALAEYGIPTVTWSESAQGRRTIANICDLYDRLDLPRMQQNALRALSSHGRSMEHPCVRSARTHEKISRRVPFLIRACNLLPGLMTVPVPRGGHQSSWEPIRAIDCQQFSGDVFSMDVARLGHYVADGIVTHNCFYGWREGAAHQFLGPNNAVDVWSVKKVNPQSMQHLTEKPVELARRALHYSSRAGENVLDLFGGSGSTLIAAEETGRSAYLMEIDLLYADVILTRWQKFTGKEAVLHGTEMSYDEVARERAKHAEVTP